MKLTERYDAIVQARNVERGQLIAFLQSGELARREGTVTESEASEGARWEGLAGLPVFRLLNGDRVHVSPRGQVLLVEDATRV